MTTRDSITKKCFTCHQAGHLARNCRQGRREQEATGNLKKTTGGDTRQVSTEDWESHTGEVPAISEGATNRPAMGNM